MHRVEKIRYTENGIIGSLVTFPVTMSVKAKFYLRTSAQDHPRELVSDRNTFYHFSLHFLHSLHAGLHRYVFLVYRQPGKVEFTGIKRLTNT